MAVLDTLASMGADALANHYTIVFPSTIASLAIPDFSQDQLAFRVNNVSIPDKTINTYPITKRGLTFDRPSGNNDSSREVTFQFRPDKEFLTYKALSAWMDLIQSNINMFMLPDGDVLNPFRIGVDVYAIQTLSSESIFGESIPTALWHLDRCFPTSLGGIQFDDATGEPLTVDVTLNCFKIYYPDQSYTGASY